MHLGVLLTISIVAAFDGGAAKAPPPSTAVRIMNWNIDKGKRLDAVAEAIRRFHPDLVLLQEVDANARRTRNVSITKSLADRLGFRHGVFAPAFQELGQGDADSPAWNGQAVLSRLPVRSARAELFDAQTRFWSPAPWVPSWGLFQRRLGGRVAQVVEVEAAGRPLVLLNLHLESRSARARRRQLDEMLQRARNFGPDVAVVLAGDLNTHFRPGGYIRRIEREGFRNCFGDARPRTHRWIGKVDYVFVRGPVRCTDAQVHRGVPGSDHFPITAVLELPAAPR